MSETNGLIFKEEPTLIKICPNLELNRRENCIPDLIINTTNDEKVYAHRIIMASRFPSMKQKLSESINSFLHWKNYSHSVIEKIVTFAYTGEIEITLEDAYQLMLCASSIDCAFVSNSAAEFIGKRLNSGVIDNAWNIAKTANSTALKNSCLEFIASHLEAASLAISIFQQLDFFAVQHVLSQAKLHSVPDEVQLEAIISWLQVENESDNEEKNKSFHSLAQSINWREISSNSIARFMEKVTHLANYTSIRSIFVKEMVKKTFDFRLQPKNAIYIIVAKSDYDESLCVIKYNPDTATHRQAVIGEFSGSILAKTAFLNGCLYIVGGKNATSNWKQVFVYDTYDNRPRRLKDLYFNREGSHVLTTTSDELVICGGLDGEEWKSCARYNPITNKWKHLPNLKEARAAPSVTCCLENDRIFVAGGWNGFQSLATVEMLTSEWPVWLQVAPMHQARYAHGSALIKSRLLVAGGVETSGGDVGCSVEILSPMPQVNGTSGQWTRLENMTRRFKVRSLVVNSSNEIFAFGHSHEVECFTKQTSEEYSIKVTDFTDWHWKALPGLHSCHTICGAHLV